LKELNTGLIAAFGATARALWPLATGATQRELSAARDAILHGFYDPRFLGATIFGFVAQGKCLSRPCYFGASLFQQASHWQ
jgi:hypothetical protein